MDRYRQDTEGVITPFPFHPDDLAFYEGDVYAHGVWIKAWQVIAAMEGLHDLRVVLDTEWCWVGLFLREWYRVLWEPLKRVVKPEFFELVLSKRAFATAFARPVPVDDLDLELPCQLTFHKKGW